MAMLSLSCCLLATGCSPTHNQPNVGVGAGVAVRVPLGSPRNVVAPTVLGLRKFPYPYQAMLAISSDADHQTLRKFNLIHRYLNTTQWTPMGRGLGLDISDSFFMYNGSDRLVSVDYNRSSIQDELTYFRGLSGLRYAGDIIDAYIHSGWMDTIHTYGDFNMNTQSLTRFSRPLASQALSTLNRQGDLVSVWVDHGNKSNVDNFGRYGASRFFSYQQGANPRSPYYHTDLLIPFGVRFVWTGESGDLFGLDNAIYPILLPDGHRVWGFRRYTAEGYTRHTGTEWVWTVDRLAEELSPYHLASIEWNHQYAIVGQHLSADNEVVPLPGNGIIALNRLANEYHRGRILVVRTSRLLQYNVTQQYLRYYVTDESGKAVIHLTAVNDPVTGPRAITLADIRGVTFYTRDPSRTELRIWNARVAPSLVQVNPSDGYAPSISIKWYPADTTDYSVISAPYHYVI